MKTKLLIALILLVGVVSCTQRTCPTYTRDSIKKIEKPEKTV